MSLPEPNSFWLHERTGGRYRVICVTNTFAPSEKFPVTVVYQNIKEGHIWSRRYDSWCQSFVEYDEDFIDYTKTPPQEAPNT